MHHIAIVGATGMVGRTFLKVLDERHFPIGKLSLFASEKSAGKTIYFRGEPLVVETLTPEVFNRDIDIALFSAGGTVSEVFAPIARAQGVVVVDNSSAWRMHPDVPLVVPEVNGDALNTHSGLIANPNCSTIQCMAPLKALNDAFGLNRVVYNTYQSVSGSGIAGLKALETDGASPYAHPIAFNILPHIDVFLPNGYTKEEMKMIEETRKILGIPELKVTATTVRVPVRYGHCVSVNVALDAPFDLEAVREVFKSTEGVVLMDDPENALYPTPLAVEGKDAVFVGRLRRDESVENGLNLWIVADNIRKGAATNAVQIAEQLIR